MLGRPIGFAIAGASTVVDGTLLRGWWYAPETVAPAVAMAHGFSAVKEMALDRYAAVFREAGLGVLVYDHRNFGASDGEPRQEIEPVLIGQHHVGDDQVALTVLDPFP